MNANMTNPQNQQRKIGPTIEIELDTLKRLLHLVGEHAPFNHCFREVLYVTRICDAAEGQLEERAAEKIKSDAVSEYQATQAKQEHARAENAKQDSLKAASIAVAKAESLLVSGSKPHGPGATVSAS